MPDFPVDGRVAVRPFAHHREGEAVTLADPDRDVYLSIPAEGFDILEALAAGMTVGEASTAYELAHAETPDIQGFLEALASEGFVAAWGDEAPAPERTPGRRGSLGLISPRVAGVAFSSPVLWFCAALVGLALGLALMNPGLVPGPTVLVFHQHLAVLATALFGLNLVAVLVHEFGHLLAARASGVPARIGISNRLWIIVAQTDMSGIWLVAKRRRYLAFLGGPIIDATSAAVLIALLQFHRRGWVGMSPEVVQFTGAALWSCFIRLLWQCFVFVRTDFYFVIATALDCKSLLADTENLLRNRWAKLRGRTDVVDQSSIPPREMHAVRVYSVVWTVGRIVAIASLILVTLPIMEGYGSQILRSVTGRPSSFGGVDLVTLAALGFAFQAAGIVMWVRNLHHGRRQRSIA